MVLPRADGTGFFTTEKPDRVYKTERGAKQAERMFQNPQLYQGWTRQGRQQQNTILDTIIDEAEDFVNDETGLDFDLNNNEEEYSEPEREDPFINWYELPRSIQDSIHNSPSTIKCLEELLSNGWTGVHLSSIIEDFGEDIAELYFPEFFV